MFDHNKDGIRTATGWVKPDDGLLVLDRNGDGIINNGGELFGDSTLLADGSRAAHGYAALAELDSNGDGKVDAADEQFADLRVWRDLNSDGISTASELFTLEELALYRSTPPIKTPTPAWPAAIRWCSKAALPRPMAAAAKWAM